MPAKLLSSRFLLPLGLAFGLAGCGSDDADSIVTNCPEAGCSVSSSHPDAAGDVAAEFAAETTGCGDACQAVCGDGLCQGSENATDCPADCSSCATLADISELITNGKLFIGYSSLGTSSTQLSCSELGEAKEVVLSVTPAFSGKLVLSTQHPTTKTATVLEVRDNTCDGSSLGCAGTTTKGISGSRLTVAVEANKKYLALVESSDSAAGVFALGAHVSGVCDGEGASKDITAELLTGKRWEADTSTSTSSLRGSCSAAADNSPEARFSFVAPRDGTVAATTVHPKTAFKTLLHVHESPSTTSGYCDSPEAEIACAAEGAPGNSGSLVRFPAHAGLAYDVFLDGTGASAAGLATLTLGYAATSPVKAALQGCSHASIQDQYAFLVQTGQKVSMKVDTVDAATAADTRLRIRLPDGTELVEADDDFNCTFPPPKYSCPQHTFTASVAGLYTAEVYVGTSENCANHSLANYAIELKADDQPGELIAVKDQ